MEIAFVVGSPRSGTTILENVLDFHPEIAEWYEPYYLWEKFFPVQNSDVWNNKYLTGNAKKNIQREFSNYRKKSQKPIVLDKLPYHSFNLEIIYNIFPHAKWIHILRDGRDVTLSVSKEWKKREQFINNNNIVEFIKLSLSMLKRQPFWRYRFMAILYELRNHTSFNLHKYLNKSRWKGKVGWGPRFEGWEEFLQSHSALEFNAMQWLKSVEAVRKSWSILPENNKIEIRYEDLLRFPEETLNKILNTLGVEPSAGFFERIPKLKTDNFGKWAKGFKTEEIRMIKPILAPMIEKLGYAHPSEW